MSECSKCGSNHHIQNRGECPICEQIFLLQEELAKKEKEILGYREGAEHNFVAAKMLHQEIALLQEANRRLREYFKLIKIELNNIPQYSLERVSWSITTMCNNALNPQREEKKD